MVTLGTARLVLRVKWLRERKKRKGLMLFIGALLLALAITCGLFAYGHTTATLYLGVTGEADFATVTPRTGPSWTAWGSCMGRIPPSSMFQITPATDWNGDMSVILRIANAQDLIECYGILVLEIEIWDTGAQLGTTEYLSLGKGGQIYIDVDYSSDTPYTVEVISGYYVTHSSGWPSGREDPAIYCQVLQRSAPSP